MRAGGCGEASAALQPPKSPSPIGWRGEPPSGNGMGREEGVRWVGYPAMAAQSQKYGRYCGTFLGVEDAFRSIGERVRIGNITNTTTVKGKVRQGGVVDW